MISLFRSIHNYLYYFDCIGLSIPLIVFAFFGRQISFSGKKFVVGYYLIYWCTTILATIVSDFDFLTTNNWIYDLTPLLLIIPLYLFFNQLHDSSLPKRVNKVMAVLVIISYLITYKNILNGEFNPEYYLLFASFILINSVFYLIGEIIQLKDIFAFKKTEFWFIASLFFYASVCSLLWTFFKYLELLPKSNDSWQFGSIWPFAHNTTLFIQSFVFSISMLWNRRRQQ
jgi:hypothetical protein